MDNSNLRLRPVQYLGTSFSNNERLKLRWVRLAGGDAAAAGVGVVVVVGGVGVDVGGGGVVVVGNG